MQVEVHRRAKVVRRTIVVTWVFAIGAIIPGSARSAAAQGGTPPRYDVVELGAPDPSGIGGYATAINNSGQIVGTYSLGTGPTYSIRSFLYDIATATSSDLGAFSDRRNLNAWGVNDNQQVVGGANTLPDGTFFPSFRGFLWENGGLTDLTPDGSPQSGANAINNAGQIAGLVYVTIPFGTVQHAAVFSGGSWTDLGTLFPGIPGAPFFNPSEATGINASGQVVGYFNGNAHPRSFLYTPGVPATWIELNPLCPFAGCEVYPDDINDRGEVVGRFSYPALPATALPFLYSGGEFKSLPILGGPGNWAFAINNSGQVVGYGGAGGRFHGFLYEAGTTYDLNDLITPGWNVEVAYDINDGGLIVGGGQKTSDGSLHGLLLVPKVVDAGGPYSVAEGGSITLTASPLGTKPITSYAWDLDDDGTFETAGQSVRFDAANLDGPLTRTVRVKATGPDASGVAETTVNVTNVAPTAQLQASRTTLYVGQSTTLSLVNPFDPSPADAARLTYAFDCTSDGYPDPPTCTYSAVGTFVASATISDDDGGTSYYWLTISVRTPRQGLLGLIEQVQGLVPPLNGGQANALIAKLNAAIAQLDRGNVGPAINQIQAFINEVGAFVQSGKLDAATGASLIAAANDVIAALQS